MSKPVKILIVEDDQFLNSMYTTKLEMEDFKVYSASDGEKGLQLAIKEKPQVILLDLMMPIKSGFEVLEELKKHSSTKDVPVIILTNLGQKEDIDKCFKLGASDYLIKAHFIPSEVIDKIKAVLN